MMHISWHWVFLTKSYVTLVEINAGYLGETTAASGDPGLRHDLESEVFGNHRFDVHVIDTDTPSHCHQAPNAIIESSSQEKRRIHKKAVEYRRGTFTPFVL